MLRQYYGDLLTDDVLFYQSAATADVCPLAPGKLKVLVEPAAGLDRFDGSERSAGCESVKKYLEEWYPTKVQFKEHMRNRKLVDGCEDFHA